MKITIVDVERITVQVPFTPRCQIWCAREQYQWDISEVVRVTTDVPDLVGKAQEAVARGYTSHKIKGRPWWDICWNCPHADAISRAVATTVHLV